MDSKLRAQILLMAATTLGLTLTGGCMKGKSAPEGSQAASGGEQSCGAGHCGADKHAAKPESSEGAAGGEQSCGSGHCGASHHETPSEPGTASAPAAPPAADPSAVSDATPK